MSTSTPTSSKRLSSSFSSSTPTVPTKRLSSSLSSSLTTTGPSPPTKSITVSPRTSIDPDASTRPQGQNPPHWSSDRPTETGFTNPWPSCSEQGHKVSDLVRLKFFNAKEKNYSPIPVDKRELVQVRTPDWGRGVDQKADSMKVTWLGHAGFVVEMPKEGVAGGSGNESGVTILLDVVLAERFSPVSFAGPKRFTPAPCTATELPDIDIICISHNHYDHLDFATIQTVCERRKGPMHVFVPLGVKTWFVQNMAVTESEVTECDWWDSFEVDVGGGSLDQTAIGEKTATSKGRLKITCCPAQHGSGRSLWDQNKTLWCSWAFEQLPLPASNTPTPKTGEKSEREKGKSLYFAGDTAYRSTVSPSPDPCPAFSQVGQLLGPFDMALVPIGCYNPRDWMSNVHASPGDSLQICKDVRAKRAIGMHYGTIRGGISAQYEAVEEPAREWKRVCEGEGRWGEEGCMVVEIGETVVV